MTPQQYGPLIGVGIAVMAGAPDAHVEVVA